MSTKAKPTLARSRRAAPVNDNPLPRRSATPHKEEPSLGTAAVSTEFLREKLGPDYGCEIYMATLDGNCLEPVIHHGDKAFMAPSLPVRAGDFALLYSKDATHQPQLKRVVLAPPPNWQNWVSDELLPLIIVEQLNPPRQYQIRMDRLAAVHRVVATVTPDEFEAITAPPKKRVRPPRKVGAGGNVGIDLFALARQGDDDATTEAREMAAIEFEPWENIADVLADFSQPTYGEMTANIGVNLRLAAVVLGKTKAELVEAARGLCADCADDDEDHPLFGMLEGFFDTSERLKMLRDVVDAALARSMAAAYAVALDKNPTI